MIGWYNSIKAKLNKRYPSCYHKCITERDGKETRMEPAEYGVCQRTEVLEISENNNNRHGTTAIMLCSVDLVVDNQLERIERG